MQTKFTQNAKSEKQNQKWDPKVWKEKNNTKVEIQHSRSETKQHPTTKTNPIRRPKTRYPKPAVVKKPYNTKQYLRKSRYIKTSKDRDPKQRYKTHKIYTKQNPQLTFAERDPKLKIPKTYQNRKQDLQNKIQQYDW